MASARGRVSTLFRSLPPANSVMSLTTVCPMLPQISGLEKPRNSPRNWVDSTELGRVRQLARELIMVTSWIRVKLILHPVEESREKTESMMLRSWINSFDAYTLDSFKDQRPWRTCQRTSELWQCSTKSEKHYGKSTKNKGMTNSGLTHVGGPIIFFEPEFYTWNLSHLPLYFSTYSSANLPSRSTIRLKIQFSY